MTYQTATPNLTAAEGIELILDEAMNVLDLTDHSDYQRGMRDGIASALGSLLSMNEEPAKEVLLDRFRDSARSGEEYGRAERWIDDDEKRDRVVTVTEYGGHEATVSTYGPYTLAEAQTKLTELSGSVAEAESGDYGGFDYSDDSVGITVGRLNR